MCRSAEGATMNAMRIQQELVAKGLEPPRTFEDRARTSEAREFLTRSLRWELRLTELRAEAAGGVLATAAASAA
jgi:hypothetical protein